MHATAQQQTQEQAQVQLGLDHIPVAVADLEQASATFRGLGFTLKQGRPHANGIRNVHVKLPNGAGIELLTAPQAVDELSAHYIEVIRSGEGPAFVSFHARDTKRLHEALRKGGYEFRHEGEVTTLPSPEFAYLFMVRDNRSPTDRSEHFAHANGTTSLHAVWIATGQGEELARLLVQLGGRMQRRELLAPLPVLATVVSLSEGEVVILPEKHQLISGRAVIGASFTVSDLAGVRRALAQAEVTPWTASGDAKRVVVAPDVAYAMWLEFREGL